MAIANIYADGDFSANVLSKVPPVVAGCKVWSYFGVDLAHSQNVGDAGAYSAFNGGPDWHTTYAHMKGANGALASPAVNYKNTTILFVAKNPGGGAIGGSAAIWSNTGVGTMQIDFNPLTGAVGFSQFNALLEGAAHFFVSPVISSFKFYAVTGGGGVAEQFYNLTDNTAMTPGPVASPASNSALPQYLGAVSGISTNDRPVDVAFFAVYDSVIDKPTIDLFYASIKASLLTRTGPEFPAGIVV